jgi:hypothetical protein
MSANGSELQNLHGAELVKICNDKMECAARDLADFTQNGIHASYIVSLAYKCESLENALQDRQEGRRAIEREIMEGLQRICETGKRIFSNNPRKYKDYVIC